MYRLVCTCPAAMSAAQLENLGRYRHRVFVDTLKWEIGSQHARPGCEFDQFDTPDTRYVLALGANDELLGCTRLLPTNSPYLLGEVFSYLCDEKPPRDSSVWEISRYTAFSEAAPELPIVIFKYSIQAAWTQGVDQVVAVTTTALERYFLRNGVKVSRMGRPRLDKSGMLVALSFPADQFADTLLSVDHAMRRIHHHRNIPVPAGLSMI